MVREKMAQIEQTYKNEGVKMLLAEDTSEFTLEAANSVMFDLILAIVLVAIVMFFFLHSLRNALIVMISIGSQPLLGEGVGPARGLAGTGP